MENITKAPPRETATIFSSLSYPDLVPFIMMWPSWLLSYNPRISFFSSISTPPWPKITYFRPQHSLSSYITWTSLKHNTFMTLVANTFSLRWFSIYCLSHLHNKDFPERPINTRRKWETKTSSDSYWKIFYREKPCFQC